MEIKTTLEMWREYNIHSDKNWNNYNNTKWVKVDDVNKILKDTKLSWYMRVFTLECELSQSNPSMDSNSIRPTKPNDTALAGQEGNDTLKFKDDLFKDKFVKKVLK
jgi:hypothetical protein